MPIAKGQPATPEQAIKRGCCPECGRDLANLNVPHHAIEHWGLRINPDDTRYDEARRRRAMLESYKPQQEENP